jgi:RNA polymerase sigma-70 factor (ECF subfamily)
MAIPTTTTPRRAHTTSHAVTLLHQAQAGDRDALAALFREYRPMLARYVFVRIHDRDAVEDVVHDSIVDALTALADADDDVVGWLLRLAARACNRHLWARLREQRAARQLGRALAHAPQPIDPRPALLLAELVASTWLTAAQRQAIELRLHGYARDHAATVMGRSAEAVRCLEVRAIAALRHTAGTR